MDVENGRVGKGDILLGPVRWGDVDCCGGYCVEDVSWREVEVVNLITSKMVLSVPPLPESTCARACISTRNVVLIFELEVVNLDIFPSYTDADKKWLATLHLLMKASSPVKFLKHVLQLNPASQQLAWCDRVESVAPWWSLCLPECGEHRPRRGLACGLG